MKNKIIYLLIILSVFLIPRMTFAATKVEVNTIDELRNAIESTENNEIILKNDIEVVYDSTLEDEDNFLMVKVGNHTLDLNNHNITTSSISTTDYGLITVIDGSLTITGNGKVSARNVVLSAVSGTLTINGGEYISGNGTVTDNVLVLYSGKVIVNNAKFTGETYSEGPQGVEPTPGPNTHSPILRSNENATVRINRNNISKKLKDPLNTIPELTINDGTFNSSTYISNTNMTINGGTFNGNNAIEVTGNSKLTVNEATISGEHTGLMVNNTSGNPDVELNGGTYSCTDCGQQSGSTQGALSVFSYDEQQDGKEVLNSLLGDKAQIDDDTVIEESFTNIGNTTSYYYHTNNLVKVTTPVEQNTTNNNSNKVNKESNVTNPDTNDNILLSILMLITSLSVILVSAKKINN